MVNSRAILCLGSANGDIAIYYLDEPVNQRSHSSKGGRASTLLGEIKYKQALLTTFNFFTMKPPIHHANTHHAIEQGLTGGGIELTSIRYVRDIGLIATSLTGALKIFDAFSFTNEMWKTTNKTRKQ